MDFLKENKLIVIVVTSFLGKQLLSKPCVLKDNVLLYNPSPFRPLKYWHVFEYIYHYFRGGYEKKKDDFFNIKYPGKCLWWQYWLVIHLIMTIKIPGIKEKKGKEQKNYDKLAWQRKLHSFTSYTYILVRIKAMQSKLTLCVCGTQLIKIVSK